MFDKKRQDATPSNDYSAPQESTTQNTQTTSRQALIGSTIHIKGDISGDENLVIDGKVQGSIELGSKEVTIGRNGKVSANVHASVIRIEGEVQGDISGNEKVIISKTGNVLGNIVAPRVTLEDGAKFKGSIDMDPAISTPVTPIKSLNSMDTQKSESAGSGSKGS